MDYDKITEDNKVSPPIILLNEADYSIYKLCDFENRMKAARDGVILSSHNLELTINTKDLLIMKVIKVMDLGEIKQFLTI